MIEVSYLREHGKLKSIPKEVQETVQGILLILDTEYGVNRHKHQDNGGYVIVVEKESDFEEIKARTYIDFDSVIPEYVKKIACSNGETYTNSLIICNNDYTISLIIPMELTPQILKDSMIE